MSISIFTSYSYGRKTDRARSNLIEETLIVIAYLSQARQWQSNAANLASLYQDCTLKES